MIRKDKLFPTNLKSHYDVVKHIFTVKRIKKSRSKEIEHLNTVERKGKLFYKFKVKRSTRLRSSILQDSIDEIGKIKEFEREVNLNADRKRLWLGTIERMDSDTMNESMPISMNFFNKTSI